MTAQRRAESLQTVPVSVTVLQGGALQEQNNNNLQDIGQIVPGLHIVNTGGFANSLNIRGIGSGSQNPAFDQSVATFVDDIYFGRSRVIQSTFLDMDRIEVLKGPQSTFFGNNAIAGALNLVTKKPDDQFDGYVRALYGSYSTYAVEGATSLPITDTLSIRIAGTTDGTGGWIRNIDTEKRAPDQENYVGRITALWKPTDDFDATLKVEGARNKTSGTTSNLPGQLTNCPPPAPLPVNSINTFCGAALAARTPQGIDGNLNAGLAGQYALLKTNIDELTLVFHKWNQTFTSVTGYYEYHYTANADGANVGSEVLATAAVDPEAYHQLSQEFRVTSPAGQLFDYTAGIYYQTDHTGNLLNGNATYIGAEFPLLAAAGLITPAHLAELEANAPFGYHLGYTQNESVESAFGAFGWNATSQLHFSAGLRAIADHKSFRGSIAYGQETQTYGGFVPYPAELQSALPFLLGAPGGYPYARTDKALTGDAGVQYHINADAMAYASFSRGFKAGGYNGISPSPILGIEQPTFGPEHVDAYEVGLKSKWLGNRLLVNGDVFRENYKDLQVDALARLAVNQQIAVTNAANSVAEGAELELQWIMTDHFRLSANINYLEAYYSSYPNAVPTYLQSAEGAKSQNLIGQPLDFASKWSGSATAEFITNTAGDYRFSADLSPFYQTHYFNSAGTDDPQLSDPRRLRLDGKLTLENTREHWAIDILGKNLTNNVIPVAYTTSVIVGGKEEPVNVSIQGRYKW